MRSSLDFAESLSTHLIALFPAGGRVNVLRQWAGLCDMTPDYSPIISMVDDGDGFYINCGWGTWGFKGSPASGWNTAQMVAERKTPERIAAFRHDRYVKNRLVGEKAAASVGN